MTCRHQEYQAIAAKVKLRLNAAINLLPLRQQQIEQYLAAGGKAWAGLRGLLKEDAELRELAQSPLCLSLMALAYHNVPLAEARSGADSGDKDAALFERYIAKMFDRRKEAAIYPKEKVLAGLSWLAKNMRQRGQTLFLLEYMQPDLLPSVLGYRLLFGLVWFGILFFCVVYGNLTTRFAESLLAATMLGFLSGAIEPMENVSWSWEKINKSSGLDRFTLFAGVLFVAGAIATLKYYTSSFSSPAELAFFSH